MINAIIETFGLKVNKIAKAEEARSSTVYRCVLEDGEDVYIKVPYSQVKYDRVYEAYRVLRGKVPIPDLIDTIPSSDTFNGALLISTLKGKPLTTDSSAETAFQVGQLHATLHSVQPDTRIADPKIQSIYEDWSAFRDKQFYSFAEDVKQVISENLYGRARAFYEERKAQLPTPDGPAFIHMDFRPTNILIDQGNVTGVIDFESVRFGATDTDFTKIYRDYLSFDQQKLQAYQKGYRTVRALPDLEKILPFYQFTDAFNSLGWCKRRGLEHHQLFFDENLTRLKNFLDN